MLHFEPLVSFGVCFFFRWFRCTVLVDSVTTTVFSYVRRGLFERDKLTVATMLTLKILVNDSLLAQEEVDYLVMSKVRKTHRSSFRTYCIRTAVALNIVRKSIKTKIC